MISGRGFWGWLLARLEREREEGSKKRIRCRCEENDVEGSGTLAKCLSPCSGYVETWTRR